jgi:hypothetical protein
MKELKAMIGLLVIVVTAFVFYKVFPAYWGNFKLGRLLDERAVYYTYQRTSDDDIAAAIADKAHTFDVPLAPEQVKITRGGGDLQISADYSVHIDMPIYPLDLNFHTVTKNHDVMK